MKRFYFTIGTKDIDANDHGGNIRGASSVAKTIANEVKEIVFINDCATDDILDVVYPD